MYYCKCKRKVKRGGGGGGGGGGRGGGGVPRLTKCQIHFVRFSLSVQGSFRFLFLSGGHCGPLCMSRGESSILSFVGNDDLQLLVVSLK